ncbi:hypothetical protein EMIT0P265_10837 [Pseudomonas zeae]
MDRPEFYGGFGQGLAKHVDFIAKRRPALCDIWVAFHQGQRSLDNISVESDDLGGWGRWFHHGFDDSFNFRHTNSSPAVHRQAVELGEGL